MVQNPLSQCLCYTPSYVAFSTGAHIIIFTQYRNHYLLSQLIQPAGGQSSFNVLSITL